jgi:hypothetical protein
MNKIYLVIFLGFIISCSNKNREVTIFSIPTASTPSKLEENGFSVIRDNFSSGRYSPDGGEVEFCGLDLVYANVYASYDEDTTAIARYVIRIDKKPFEKMTGLKAKNYESVEIEGFDYKVEEETSLSLKLTRLGI